MSNIVTSLINIRENISKAAKNANRRPSDITLVCVTKQVPVKFIKEAVNAGITVIGENRVEEALAKWGKLPEGIQWHMVGHLQTRKVKEAVNMFSLIHSVDSVRLSKEIDKRSQTIGKVQDILIEVNISGEESKYGFKLNEVIPAIKEMSGFPNIRIMGLMTMAPFVDDPEFTRPVFRGVIRLKDEIISHNIPNVQMKYFSMGMTQDYMAAIEEGANMIRIGTAIFGGII